MLSIMINVSCKPHQTKKLFQDSSEEIFPFAAVFEVVL